MSGSKYIEKDGGLAAVYVESISKRAYVPSRINDLPVLSIEKRAFDLFTDVIKISGSIKEIDELAFRNCEILTNIVVDETNRDFMSIDGVLFDKSGKKLICYPQGKKDDEYTVPDGVTEISNYAFFKNNFLRKITFPESLVRIGDNNFVEHPALENVYIPDSVNYIGNAFILCKFRSFYIPAGVKSIGSYSFSRCIIINEYSVADENQAYMSRDGMIFSKDGKTLIKCPSGPEKNMPDGIVSISDHAFTGCWTSSVTIPNGVVSIGAGAFDGCSAKRIVIPNSVAKLGDRAFWFYYPISLNIGGYDISVEVKGNSGGKDFTDLVRKVIEGQIKDADMNL